MVDLPNTIIDFPNTVVDLPNTMVDLPKTMVDRPNTLVDLPNTMADLPNTMVDLPNSIVDLPNTMVDFLNTMVDLPNTIVYLSNKTKQLNKQFGLARRFAQLVQKLNQNVSVKHPIWKINSIPNSFFNSKFVLTDLVPKLVNLFVFVNILCKIISPRWFLKRC